MKPTKKELAAWLEASRFTHATYPTPRSAAEVFRHAAASSSSTAAATEAPGANAEWEGGPEASPTFGRAAYESQWANAHGVYLSAEAEGGWVLEVNYCPPEAVGEPRGGPCCPHGGGFSPAES